ncbi:glycosyltransferase [Halobacillus sp. A1]|uniref:glycosyltransferase n=1 Tax=Halobacillus sp. A1 TaxID=2880262 RepID=UPI0020A67456|nr:glycosyltransferase [Halobacillus sp. A1]MCP3032933.1 glycosyltransferase [Halobacillus sp. A1]
MNKIKYSVLMSVYNGENEGFLKSSIESMFKQTQMPDEIVIVVDGPINDKLISVIKSYDLNYPGYLTVVELEKNVGLGKALNIGLTRCKNELVARMDTDDISLSNRCEKQIKEFIKDPELCIIGSNIDEFYDNPNEVFSSRVVPSQYKEILKFSKRRNPFNHPTVMYKKSTVLDLGGYGDFRRNQDLDLFVRILHNGHKAKNINESLLLFRANIDNLKRRKSWRKCTSYIVLIYNFWRMGHSSILDLIIVFISQIVILIMPIWFLERVSSKYLRKEKTN